MPGNGTPEAAAGVGTPSTVLRASFTDRFDALDGLFISTADSTDVVYRSWRILCVGCHTSRSRAVDQSVERT